VEGALSVSGEREGARSAAEGEPELPPSPSSAEGERGGVAAARPEAGTPSTPPVLGAATTSSETILSWATRGAGARDVIGPGPAGCETIAAPAAASSVTIGPHVLHLPKVVVGFNGGPRGSSLIRPGEISCDRPGCYELFVKTRRSPTQRFCTKPCRCAVERVRQRETRWHARRGLGPPRDAFLGREIGRKY
jgi:hypothetical protein